ncbi:hypothetical protein [Croceibacterium ferulae]|uniref:hypothetical protein n=1 Tax=Croceibacterium ferulae TaxID=1854641 RepID=UPI000EB49456|nr:hypothetical protein [Croceibacterium ferulae]
MSIVLLGRTSMVAAWASAGSTAAYRSMAAPWPSPVPAAAKNYSNLRVHLWQRSVGKEALNKPGASDAIVEALATIIDEDEGASDWLVVSYKSHSVEDMLRKALKANNGERLNFLTWGMHHGTNAYAHCRRVVLIGQLTYGTSGYRALAAACGVSVEEDVGPDLMAGEYRHNLLQALTRAHVRRNENGVAGNCQAYVIASKNVGAFDLLSEVFPGCMIERWAPDAPEVCGRAGQLIALLEDGFTNKVKRIAKKDLAAALNMKGPNLSRLLGESDVVIYLAERHLRSEHLAIVYPELFEPYPGGGFTIDQLDAPG